MGETFNKLKLSRLLRMSADKEKEARKLLRKELKPTREQLKLARHIMLRENFPTVAFSIMVVIGFIGAIGLIAFQIAGIVVKAPFYFIGGGVWAGAIFFAANLVNLTLLFKHTDGLYLAAIWCTRLTYPFLIALAIIHFIANAGCSRYFQCDNQKYDWINIITMISAIICKVDGAMMLRLFSTRIHSEATILKVLELLENETEREVIVSGGADKNIKTDF